MNYSYAICVPRVNQAVYNWTMSLESIDKLFTTKSRDEILLWLKQNDSVLKENDSSKLQIMKKVSNTKYISERYTYIIDNPHYLNYDIGRFLLGNIKMTHKLHSILLPFEKRNVSPLFKQMISILEEKTDIFVGCFAYLPYEEKRIIWTILSEEKEIAKELDRQEEMIETLEDVPVVLKRKAS